MKKEGFDEIVSAPGFLMTFTKDIEWTFTQDDINFELFEKVFTWVNQVFKIEVAIEQETFELVLDYSFVSTDFFCEVYFIIIFGCFYHQLFLG